MLDWAEMCEVTRKQLDRELSEQEMDFLQWVYETHMKETTETEARLEPN